MEAANGRLVSYELEGSLKTEAARQTWAEQAAAQVLCPLWQHLQQGRLYLAYKTRFNVSLYACDGRRVNLTRHYLVAVLSDQHQALRDYLPQGQVIWEECLAPVPGERIEAAIVYTGSEAPALDQDQAHEVRQLLPTLINHELFLEIERYRSILNTESHLIWSVNRDLEYTGFNRNFLELILQRRPNFEATPGARYKFEEANEELRLKWEEAYKLAFEGKHQRFEIRSFDRRSEVLWWEVFLNPVMTFGQLEEVTAIANDITSKKAAERDLMEREEQFRNIFESFTDLYWETNAEGNIELVSPSVKALFGFEQEEVIGRNVYELFTPVDTEIPFWRGLSTQTSIPHYKVRVRNKSGEEKVLLSSFSVTYDEEGNVLSTKGVSKDITELERSAEELRKAQLQAEQSLRSKEQFLANISHEIRTPMTGLSGALELLEAHHMPAECRELVNIAQQSGKLMLTLLQDFLDVADLETGQLTLQQRPVNLHSLFSQHIKSFEPEVKEKGLSYVQYVDERLPAQAICDDTRVVQIINNLLTNALKFTSKGSIAVAVQMLSHTATSAKISMVVSDSGVGIATEQQAHIFDKFNPADSSSTKLHSGTGLGLSIARRLARLMNGDINVTSQPGLGSRFNFTFDVPLAQELPEPVAETPALPSPESKSWRILLVDDNQINRLVLRELLKHAGTQAEEAASGPDAIKRCQHQGFDMVLMDVQMPGMDGITAMREIKAQQGPQQGRFIAITAYANSGDRERLLALGFDDYLAKPVSAASIKDMLNRWRNGGGKPATVANAPAGGSFDPQIINMATLETLRSYLGTDQLHQSLADFEAETLEQLEMVREALKKPDLQGLEAAAHSIKGNALTLGIEKVGYFAREVEQGARSAARYETLTLATQQLLASFHEYVSVKSVIQ